MESNKGFAYAYGWNSYYDKILGIRSKKTDRPIVRQRAWIWSLLIFLSIWLPGAASLPFLWHNLNLSIECLSTNMPIMVGIAKMVNLQCKKKVTASINDIQVTGSILVSMVNDWSRVETKEAYTIMSETARISNIISILSVALTNAMFFAFTASRLWVLLQVDAPDLDDRLTSNLLLVSYFPFDITNLKIFNLIWFCQLCGSFLSMTSYAGSDCFLAMLVLHLCGQLRIVRYSLKYIANETTIHNPQKYRRKISEIVERHEQLNQLSINIKDTFSPILLIQMLACSLTLCFQCYAMINNIFDRHDGPFPVLYLAFSLFYACYTLIHLYVYCYVGDRLLIESTNLGNDFYQTAWYNLEPEQAKDFILVSSRSKSPLEIKAGQFCTFNLQLFIGIMKNSMGYLSMLMAMKDRLRH